MVISKVEVTMSSDGTQAQTLLSDLIPNFTGQSEHCHLLSASIHNVNNNGWYNFCWLEPTSTKIGIINTSLRYMTTQDEYKGQKIHAIIGWYKQ